MKGEKERKSEKREEVSSWLLWLLGAWLSGPQVPVQQRSGRTILVDGIGLKLIGGAGDDYQTAS